MDVLVEGGKLAEWHLGANKTFARPLNQLLRLKIAVDTDTMLCEILRMTFAPNIQDMHLSCEDPGHEGVSVDVKKDHVRSFFMRSASCVQNFVFEEKFNKDFKLDILLEALPHLSRVRLLDIQLMSLSDACLNALVVDARNLQVSAPDLETIRIHHSDEAELHSCAKVLTIKDDTLLAMLVSRTKNLNLGKGDMQDDATTTRPLRTLEFTFGPNLRYKTLLEMGALRSSGLEVVINNGDEQIFSRHKYIHVLFQ